jgi:hypothetical protein
MVSQTPNVQPCPPPPACWALSQREGWHQVPCPLPEGEAYDRGAEQLGYTRMFEWGAGPQVQVIIYRAADCGSWLVVTCGVPGCDLVLCGDWPSLIQVATPLVQLAAADLLLDVADAAKDAAGDRRRPPEPPEPPRPPRPRTPRGWRRQ